MPKLSELMADEAPLTIPFELGELHVIYRPRVVTTQWQQRIVENERTGSDPEKTLYTPIKESVTSWDLEQGDGTPYPITSEAMEAIPRHILTNLLMAVVASARPNPTRLLASFTDGSSAPADRKTSRRSGTS